MKNKLIFPLVVVVVAACGGDGDQTARQSQGQYETVQEGSASGVTSTISGPGETVPITGTNADTTTAFALSPAAVAPAGAVQQAGTVAGTLPAMTAPYPSGGVYNPAPSGVPIPRTAVQQQAPRPMTSASPAPQPLQATPPSPAPAETTEPAPAPAEPATDPAVTTPAPPAPSTNAAPPAEKPKDEQPAEEPAEGEEQEETEEEPPPPPPGA